MSLLSDLLLQLVEHASTDLKVPGSNPGWAVDVLFTLLKHVVYAHAKFRFDNPYTYGEMRENSNLDDHFFVLLIQSRPKCVGTLTLFL